MTAGGARNLLMACIVAIVATTAGGGPASATPSMASATSAWKAVGAPHVIRPFGHSQAAASTAVPAAVTRGSGPLVYQGGPVQVQPKVYLDFWAAAWTNPAVVDSGGYNGVAAQNYITAFLGDIGGSPWFNSQTQYCENVANGATSCPGNVLTLAHRAWAAYGTIPARRWPT